MSTSNTKNTQSKSIFARNLKFLRNNAGISQTKLSQDLLVPRNRIASYELRNIEPKLSLLVKIAEYFKIRIDDLLSIELNSENLEKIQNVEASSEDLVTPNNLDLKLNSREKISKFIEENDKVRKILAGIKAFRKITKSTKTDSDSNQLLEVLEFLIRTNQNLILNINSTKND